MRDSHDPDRLEPPALTTRPPGGARGALDGLIALAVPALDFVFYVIIARRLGATEFGRFFHATCFAILFTVVADFGIKASLVREGIDAPDRAPALLRRILPIKLGLALATLAVTIAIGLAAGMARDTLVIVSLASVAVIIGSAATLFETLLRSAGRVKRARLSLVVKNLGAIVIGTALVFPATGARAAAIAWCAASILHLAAATFWSRDLWSRPQRAEQAVAHKHEVLARLRDAAPLALSGAFILLYFRADSVLLTIVSGPRATGLFGACIQFFAALVLISAAYRSVLLPALPRADDRPSAALAVLCRKSLRLQLMVTVGVAVFVGFQAKQVLTVVLGEEYAAAAPALSILMWALPGAFLADTLLHLLAVQRRQSVGARVMALTVLFNVMANLVVIPRFSFVGAAVVTVLSQLLSFTLMYLAFDRAAPRVNLFTVARAPLLAGAFASAAMVLLSRLSPGGPMGLVLMATFTITAYLLALVALGAIGRHDADLLTEILPSETGALMPNERRAA
jgi:O-antigen/teichoic acid export membrane protein